MEPKAWGSGSERIDNVEIEEYGGMTDEPNDDRPRNTSVATRFPDVQRSNGLNDGVSV